MSIESLAEPQIIQVLDGRVSFSHDYIVESAYYKPGDLVIVGGSLIEGLGNEMSDIDVYVITSQLRSANEIEVHNHHRVLDIDHGVISNSDCDSKIRLIHTVVPNSKMKVDVEFRTFEEFFATADKLVSIFDYARENLVLLTKFMVYREIAILHRFYNSVVIRGQDIYDKITQKFSPDFYHYVSYRWVASDFSVLLDILGAWRKNEIDRAVDLSRENLALQMQGFLSLNRLSNTRKWLLSMVDRLSPEFSKFIPRFKNLYLMYGVSDSETSKRKYVKDALDFVDEIYEASQILLNDNVNYPSGEEAIKSLEQYKSKMETGYAQLELEYRSKVYGLSGWSTSDLLNSSDILGEQ